MAKYQLVTYDVWGNPEDGLEVNNVYRYDVFYDISDTETNEEIIHRLCTEEKQFPSIYSTHGQTATFLKPEAESKVEIVNDFQDFAIELADTETGEPIGRLELVEE